MELVNRLDIQVHGSSIVCDLVSSESTVDQQLLVIHILTKWVIAQGFSRILLIYCSMYRYDDYYGKKCVPSGQNCFKLSEI